MERRHKAVFARQFVALVCFEIVVFFILFYLNSILVNACKESISVIVWSRRGSVY